MNSYSNLAQEEEAGIVATEHTRSQDGPVVDGGQPLPGNFKSRRAAIVLLAVTIIAAAIAVAKSTAWREAPHSEDKAKEIAVKDPHVFQQLVANSAIQSAAPARQEKKAYGCITGPGSGCRTCVAQFSRTSSMDCSSCNDGYQLHQNTVTCKAVACAEFPCPSGYVVQNPASTTLSIANCCRQDPNSHYMKQLCTGENCCECGGHFNSLIGGGHTEQKCLEACLFHTHCTHAALSDGGYCHWFAGCTGTGLCGSPWTKWQKVVGTTTTTTLDVEFVLSAIGKSCAEQRLQDVHSKAVCHGQAAAAIGQGGSHKVARPLLDSPFGCYFAPGTATIGFNEHIGWTGVDPGKQYICMKATRSRMIDYCTEPDCGECSGPYNSLIGGGHTADECKSACLSNTTCFHAAFSSYGFCHMFGRLCCGSVATTEPWTVWKKLQAITTLHGSMGFHGVGLTKEQVEKASQKALAKAFGVDNYAVEAKAHEFRRLREESDDRKLIGTGSWKVTFSVASQAETIGAVAAKVDSIQSDFGLIAGTMKSELMKVGVPEAAAAVTFTTFNAAMQTTTTLTTTTTMTTVTTTTSIITTTTSTTITTTITTKVTTSTHTQACGCVTGSSGLGIAWNPPVTVTEGIEVNPGERSYTFQNVPDYLLGGIYIGTRIWPSAGTWKIAYQAPVKLYVWVNQVNGMNGGVDTFLASDGWAQERVENFRRSDGDALHVWSRFFDSGSSYSITTNALMVGGVMSSQCCEATTRPSPSPLANLPSPTPSPSPTGNYNKEQLSTTKEKGCSVRKGDSFCNSSPGSWAYENCPAYTEQKECKRDYCCVWSQ